VQSYIRDHRQKGFIDGLTRKLLSYALNRSLMLPDEPLIANMQTKLATSGYHFDSMVEAIVVSPQFRNKRGPEPGEKSPAPSKAQQAKPADAKITEAKKGM